jgi:hypothetical protein
MGAAAVLGRGGGAGPAAVAGHSQKFVVGGIPSGAQEAREHIARFGEVRSVIVMREAGHSPARLHRVRG